jgi:hypothetical protein
VNLLAGLGRAAALIMGLGAIVMLGFTGAFHFDTTAQTFVWLLIIGSLLAGAVLGWLLWGYFANGAKWSYWLVTFLAVLSLAGSVLGTFWPQALGARQWLQPQTPALGAIQVLAAAAVLLILMLPKTRRHFRSHK